MAREDGDGVAVEVPESDRPGVAGGSGEDTSEAEEATHPSLLALAKSWPSGSSGRTLASARAGSVCPLNNVFILDPFHRRMRPSAHAVMTTSFHPFVSMASTSHTAAPCSART